MATARRKRRGRPPRSPRAIERAYAADLRRTAGDLRAAAESALRVPLERAARLEREAREDAPAEPFAGIAWDDLRVRFGRITGRASGIVNKYGRQISAFNASAIAEILPIDLLLEPANVTAVLDAWRSENLRLISDIGTGMLDALRAEVREATQKGTRVETLAARITERYAITERRARVIASDQILKANGNLTKQRHQAAGITRYTWGTSRDEKVRPTHQILDGRIFSWDDPPITNERGDRNHPGEDILCRCNAIPILD